MPATNLQLPDFDWDGRIWTGYSPDDAAAKGVPAEVIAAAVLAAERAAMICTPRQARLALSAAGLLGAVEAWVATAPEAIRIDWEYAQVVRRDYPPVVQAGAALGLSEAQIDVLFEAAAGM